MKILQVTSFFKPSWEAGGIARESYELSKRLAEKGHEVTVYTTDGFKSRVKTQKNRPVLMEGMEVFYFSNISLFLASRNVCIPYLFPFISRNTFKRFDIIHIHSFRSLLALFIWYYAKKHGIPYVLQAHGSVDPNFQKRGPKNVFDLLFGYRILKDSSKVIALNLFEAQQYRDMGLSREKIKVIPNGIDLSVYSDLPPKGSFKKKFDIPEDEKVILYLGRLHKTKRIDFLIRAYAYLRKDMKYNDAVLVIAGPDDGYLDEVRFLVSSLGISASARFTGFISSEDKLTALVDADVFVTPSFHGFPVTFLEACATGTPIVTTDLGDTLEWIDGSVGYVALPTYPDMARAIHRIVFSDELREIFSRNCREIVRSEFSLEKVVDKLERTYREVAVR